ncbi:ribonuclease P protein component [uncultured Piscinibacter sp.]|uniref:ribonuclease P protein component n=1 Tax=uncultured Piscinibacter sp. TaxID=1131835 RepID=UPI002638FC1B|nr:ribonuclease P protein component [uncultured Piscinibacter sp.]
MIGRIVRSADFERVLRCPPKARTAHFAVHHLRGVPTLPLRPQAKRESGKLSTGEVPLSESPVDDSISGGLAVSPTRWLGMVIPKRHARRSVTRTLLKRQIRAAVGGAEGLLAEGLWVVRLRSPFDRQSFPSAGSAALASAAGMELAALMQQAAA